MPPYRNAMPSGPLLARRLDQLRSTLDSLSSQLRTAVSQAVGETVGVVVRDAMSQALDRITGFLPHLDERPPPRSRNWEDEDEPDVWPGDDWEHNYSEPREPTPPAESRPQRLAVSVSAGLSAAAWWLRRWTGRLGLASTAAVGLIASCTAYAAPALAAAGLRMLGSVGQIALLSDTIQSLAST